MGAQIIMPCTVSWMVSMSIPFCLTTDSTWPSQHIKTSQPLAFLVIDVERDLDLWRAPWC